MARSGSEPIDLCIFDFPTRAAAAAERVMLHPENSEDFTNRGLFEGWYIYQFRNYPETDLRFDHQLGLTGSNDPNCIKMEDAGNVSGLTPVRLHELSVHRAYLTERGHDTDSTAGKYHLSIIMFTDEEITPDDENAVLRVTLSARNILDTTNIVEQVFDVPGSAFRNAAGPIINQVIEYHLGMIELRLDSLHDVPNRPREFSIIDWREGIFPLHQDDMERTNPAGIPTTEIQQGLYYRFDVSLEYLSATTGAIYVDAICFSHPAAYALFRPGDPHCLPFCADYHADFTERLGEMLFEDPAASPPTLHSRLRLIYGSEQDWDAGAWRSSKYVQDQIQQHTNGAVRLYSPTSGWSDPNRSTELMELYNNGASGYYMYPIHWEVPMKSEPMDEYYNTLYLDQTGSHWNMQFTTDRYRGYATSRKTFGTFAPWIPYIQNHSNMFVNSDIAWDGDPLREPTAAEVRVQCNLALAYRADGIMFYQFSQVPIDPDEVDIAYWPATLEQWRGNPNHRDENMGSLGFLNRDNTPRTVDCNGEDKWDSTRATIIQTRALGQYIIDSSLVWQAGKSWYGSRHGTTETVAEVVSQRQDAAWPLDSQDSTLVETTEFLSARAVRYIFVLNGRTDTLGHRHITVKLQPGADPSTEWRVTNVLTNDIFIVRPQATPDRTPVNNGFTEYFSPGAGALYRIEPIFNETVDFADFGDPYDGLDISPCSNRSIIIEPMATLRLKSSDRIVFGSGYGVLCDGQFYATGTSFRPCTVEGSWLGIVARNNGYVQLENVHLFGAGVTTGSGGTASLDEACTISQTHAALRNIGGSLTSSTTISSDVVHHLESIGNGTTWLDEDSATGNAQYASTALEVWGNGGGCYSDESRYRNFWRSAYIVDALLWGDADGVIPADGGNNSFRSEFIGLQTAVRGFIGLGDALVFSAPENHNEVIISDPQGYSAITDGTSWIEAVWNWWEPANWSHIPPPLIRWMGVSGSVVYQPALSQDPISFTGPGKADFADGTGLSKSTVLNPPSSIRGQVRAAMEQQNRGTARHLIGQFLQTSAANSADYDLLRFFHRTLRKIAAPGALDSLLTLCLVRPDLESKLLAADIASEDRLYADAVQVLNAYSFSGSIDLQKRALARKTLLYPLARVGGYQDGLLALDSLRALGDSSLHPLYTWYPILYSRLSPAQSMAVPKSSTQRLIDRALPDGVDIWPNYPNPFTDVTSFTFKLGEDMHIRLAVYDVMGREVVVVTDADYGRGVHSAVLRSDDLPSGIYFYRLTTASGVIQRKMLLMR